MKQIYKPKKLKKGEKIKINDESYLVEDFNEEDNVNDEGGSKTREVILSNKGKGVKRVLKEKYIVNVDKKSKSIKLSKTSEKGEEFKDGFSYEKSSSVVSYAEEYGEDDLANDSESEINLDYDD
ncbi:hypothetical protein HYT23_04420 [Candidatus Pacearchaeota archaeon]|nr:hypothetical protein [Candidatus Pacearchaeota archaeon]